MTPLETMAMQRFLDTVKRAAQTRSRDLRLEMSDATVLAAEIGSMLARLAQLESNKPSVTRSIMMDGGSLR